MSMNIVQAINEVIETVWEHPMSGTTAPSQMSPIDYTSIYARAEEFIRRENERVQSQGWPENTEPSRRFTPATDRITLGDSVMRIRAAGPDSHRTLVIRVETVGQTDYRRVYDTNKQTFSMGTDDVYLDTVVLLDFESLPQPLQDVIVATAKLKFQRRVQGSQLADQQLMMEYAQAESIADRNKIKDDAVAFNVRPAIPQSQPQQQQQGN